MAAVMTIMRTRRVLVFVLLMLGLASSLLEEPARTQSYGMSFSVYTTPSVGGNGLNLVVTSSAYDNSWGCTHTNYYTTSHISSPSGRSASHQASGLSSTTSMAIAGEYGNYQIGTSGTFYCGCSFLNLGFGGGQTVPVQKPTSLRVASDTYSHQQFNNYERLRIYEVLDQNGNVISLTGQPVTESYGAWETNTCGLSPITTGSTQTNNQGRFQDRYYMSGAPNCTSNPACTSRATQTIKVSGFLVRSNTVTYRCDRVDLAP